MGIDAAWAQFHAGEEPRGVRGDVVASWRRSRSSGVDPEYVEPPWAETDLDTHFVRVAAPIMERTGDLLVGDRSCLALADARGSVVWRWVSEPMLRTTLDELSVVQGFCFDEEFVGTNGLGTALETGSVAVVRGSEHFVQRFHDVTCVAAPVRHPVTRRTVGAVNVTCRAEHTNPLLRVVVLKLVEEIRAALLAAASVRERRLLDAFLDARRGGPGPVLTLGDDVVIANDAALELGLDHHALWEEARSARDGDTVGPLRLRPVRDGSVTSGVVLTAGPDAEPVPRRRPTAPGRWQRLLDDAAALLAHGPLVVRGEAGTGRTALLTTVLEGVAVVEGGPGPLPAGPLVVRHAERLPAASVAALAGRPRVGLTLTMADPVPDGFACLTVPPLRRRTDEIAGLARRELRRHGERLHLTPDALTALRRHDWPGNLPELARVVAAAAAAATGDAVGPDALPPGVRAAAGRRLLSPLERAESAVIAAVLAECGGNKSAAARELGLSRTALYAKLRGYRL